MVLYALGTKILYLLDEQTQTLEKEEATVKHGGALLSQLRIKGVRNQLDIVLNKYNDMAKDITKQLMNPLHKCKSMVLNNILREFDSTKASNAGAMYLTKNKLLEISFENSEQNKNDHGIIMIVVVVKLVSIRRYRV